MNAGFKYMLKPTKQQEQQFLSFCNAARFAYNESLAQCNFIYETTGHHSSSQELRHHIKLLKDTVVGYEWLRVVPEAVTKKAIEDLKLAFDRYFKGISKYPQFKSKKHSKLSFYQRTDNLHMVDDSHIKITGIKEPVLIHGKLPDGVTICNPRVSYDNKFWYLSFSCPCITSDFKIDGEVLGIDLGIINQVTVSDGTVYLNINKSQRVLYLEKRKRHLQRQLSRKYEFNKEGNNYKKTKNIIKLESKIRLIDRSLSNIRITYIHNITSQLISRAKTLVIEDLNVKGMLKNKYLSKSIKDSCFYEIRRQLEYKSQANGVQLILYPRFQPSSKVTHCCKIKLPHLKLSDRVITCPGCNTVIDRDYNAALNIRDYAFSH